MGKYTEGPWFLDDDKFYKLKILSKDFIEVTEVDSWDISDLEETKANARLIAAAPELLEDVQNLINDIEKIFHPAVLNGMGKQDVRYHLEKAKLDLKKAKGENNNE
jgi:hypothetical protein